MGIMDIMRKWAAVILLVLSVVIMALAQQRNSKGPFLWDDQIMQELIGVRQEHKVMMADITRNNEKISRLEQDQKNRDESKFGERLAALELKMSGLQWVGAALATAIIVNLLHSIIAKFKVVRDKGD